MTTLNSPDTADGISHHPGDLYAAMSAVADTAVAMPASPALMSHEPITGRWGDAIRASVRDNPLAALGVAALLGMWLVRRSR